MSDIAIKVENLSKCYPIFDTPRDRLKQMIIPRLQRAYGFSPRKYYREFWALRDVSFEVKRGETVGIMGRNGSGKSTLLQLICGTLAPTGGSLEVNGRIAALLELGSGFNPDFTGRENVYLNASVLGLSQQEIEARFQSIADFAEIGDFIEQPTKTYSSGMIVRLAFAVAINVDPEILIVDEALSVGDELFQRKCFARIESIKNNGATILFVSHSGGQVVELCDRAILLDSGEKLDTGLPKQILGKYQKLLYAPAEKREEIRKNILQGEVVIAEDVDKLQKETPKDENPDMVEFFDPDFRPTSTLQRESRGAFISNPTIFTLDGKPVNVLVRGRRYKYQYHVEFTQGVTNVSYGMLIKTISGFGLGGYLSNDNKSQKFQYQDPGLVVVEFLFDCNINAGTYFLNAWVYGVNNGEKILLHGIGDACVFKVMPGDPSGIRGIIDFCCEHRYLLNTNGKSEP